MDIAAVIHPSTRRSGTLLAPDRTPALGALLLQQVGAGGSLQRGGVLPQGGQAVRLSLLGLLVKVAGLMLLLSQALGGGEYALDVKSRRFISGLKGRHGIQIAGAQVVDNLLGAVIPLHFKGLALQHGGEHVTGVGLRLIFQGSLTGADGSVGLLQGLAQGPAVGVDLLLHGLRAGGVVGLTAGIVDLRHGVAQGGLPAGVGPGHLLHGAGVLAEPRLDDVHGLGAGDLTAGNLVIDLPLGDPQGGSQHTDHVHAPLLEHVQVFQTGLIAGLHATEGLGHDGHVAGAHAHGAAGVAEAGHQPQHPAGIFAKAGGQGPGHGGEVAVLHGGVRRHLPQVIQKGASLSFEELIKGDSVQLPLGCGAPARRDVLRHGLGLGVIDAGVVALECLVPGLGHLIRAAQQAHQAADAGAHYGSNRAKTKHCPDSCAGAGIAKRRGEECARISA